MGITLGKIEGELGTSDVEVLEIMMGILEGVLCAVRR